MNTLIHMCLLATLAFSLWIFSPGDNVVSAAVTQSRDSESNSTVEPSTPLIPTGRVAVQQQQLPVPEDLHLVRLEANVPRTTTLSLSDTFANRVFDLLLIAEDPLPPVIGGTFEMSVQPDFGGSMAVTLIVATPGIGRTEHITACVSPISTCRFAVEFPPGSIAAALIGYVANPTGFPAPYDVTLELTSG